jgi:hypothetical protein
MACLLPILDEDEGEDHNVGGHAICSKSSGEVWIGAVLDGSSMGSYRYVSGRGLCS